MSKKPTPIRATKKTAPDVEDVAAKVTELSIHLAEASRELKDAEAAQEKNATYQLVRMVDGGDHDPKNSHELSKHSFELLVAFLKIIRQNHGCSTPVDAFIVSLHYHATRAMTPKEIREDLDKLEEDFEEALSEAKQLHRQYPSLLASAKE